MRRLVEVQQVQMPEAALGWWSWHLHEFLRYAERKGERIEAKILARGYFDALRRSEPPVASFRIDQTQWALAVVLAFGSVSPMRVRGLKRRATQGEVSDPSESGRRKVEAGS